MQCAGLLTRYTARDLDGRLRDAVPRLAHNCQTRSQARTRPPALRGSRVADHSGVWQRWLVRNGAALYLQRHTVDCAPGRHFHDAASYMAVSASAGVLSHCGSTFKSSSNSRAVMRADSKITGKPLPG